MDAWRVVRNETKAYPGIHPTVDDWVMMDSPLSVLMVTLAYLVGVKWVGPAVMAKRQPFDLKNAIIAFNLYQIIWSGYNLSLPFWKTNISNCILNYCQATRNMAMVDSDFLFVSWGFFFSKLVDLLDTVIFVLRKKDRQISFLHLYHHSVVLLSSWYHLKYILDPSFTVLMFLNHGVHFFMYQYYLLAAMGPRFTKYLWWKKYMTKIQLIQFIVAIIFVINAWVRGCSFSKELAVFIVVSLIVLTALFLNFYVQTYVKNKIKKKE